MAYEGLAWAANPSATDLADVGATYNMGIRFALVEGADCVGIRWRVPDTVSTPPGGTHVASVWSVVGETRLRSKDFTPVPGGFQDILFDTPVTLSAATNYVAAVHTQHYVFRASGGVFPSSASGNITSDESRLVANDDPATYPSSSGSALYYVSPLVAVEAGDVAPTSGTVAVAAGAPTVGYGLEVEPDSGTIPIAAGRPFLSVTPTSGVVPLAAGQPATVGAPAAAVRGGWESYGAALRFNYDEAQREAAEPPLDCPLDGEALEHVFDGRRHCPACGWEWPARRIIDRG